jgi:hypothetical protein
MGRRAETQAGFSRERDTSYATMSDRMAVDTSIDWDAILRERSLEGDINALLAWRRSLEPVSSWETGVGD